jgi:hypothetical protein
MRQPSRSPFTRALALFLCAQPPLWMSNVAYAQTLEQQAMQAQQTDPQRAPQGQQVQPLPGDSQRSFQLQQGGAIPSGNSG